MKLSTHAYSRAPRGARHGWAMEALLVFFSLSLFAALVGCGSPSDSSSLTTDSTTTGDASDVVAVETDSGVRDADAGDAQLPCSQGSPCTKPGEICEDRFVCEKGSWQNMSSPETGVDADAADVLDAEADTPSDVPDTETVDAADTAETIPPPDATVTDTDSPDTAPLDSGKPDTGTPDSGADAPIGDSASETSPGDTGGSSDTGTPDTGATDTASDAAETATKPFSCTGWTRQKAFDDFKIDGKDDVKAVRTIRVFGSKSIFVSAGTYTKGIVAFWNGSSWSQQDLSPTPMVVYGLSGPSKTDLWLAGRDSGQGRLYHRGVDETWKEDTTAPYAKAFEDVYASSAVDVFLMGWTKTALKVWKKSGSSWLEMALPPLTLTGSFGYNFNRIWGLDAKNIFVTGYYVDEASKPTKAILLYWNGTSWKELSLPAGTGEFFSIHGTSLNDLYVVGRNVSKQGLIYHVTNGMETWVSFTNETLSGYGSVWSPRAGAMLAGGDHLPLGAGAARLTTMDPTVTTAVDSKAYSVVSFAPEPGTKTVHFVNFSSPDGVIAGHYVGTCD